MTHLSLFTGIGGLDIAAEWAGFETVGQCEFADYPTKVFPKLADAKIMWKNEPDILRVADKIPKRKERITCLGNAVVPHQAYPIFAAIAEIERIQS